MMCKMYSHYSRGTALPGGAVSALALKAIDYKHTHTHTWTCAHIQSLINISAKSHLGPGNDKTYKHAYNESSHLTMSNKTFS